MPRRITKRARGIYRRDGNTLIHSFVSVKGLVNVRGTRKKLHRGARKRGERSSVAKEKAAIRQTARGNKERDQLESFGSRVEIFSNCELS